MVIKAHSIHSIDPDQFFQTITPLLYIISSHLIIKQSSSYSKILINSNQPGLGSAIIPNNTTAGVIP